MTGRAHRRHVARATAALPDAIELLTLVIRSGMTPTAAVEAVAHRVPTPLVGAFAEVVHRMHRGERLADALDVFAVQLGPAAAGFADALATADRFGLPIEPVLDRLAIDVRADRRRLAERHARTLPVKLSFPLVLCTLPSFVLLAIAPAVIGALATLRGSVP
ncbi:MAG TPA: type II secretion system F family protein [Ilumatobacter sp.]